MTSSGFDPVREPKRPRLPLMKLSLELERDWDFTLRAFEAYRELPPHKRYRALPKLFEKICPWIERGIQASVLNHFILVQTETVVASLYGQVSQREALPRSHILFQHWVESYVGRVAAKGVEACSVTPSTPGEPSAAFCDRFNRMPYQQRMMLYMYMVERCTITEICECTGTPYPEVLRAVPRLWHALKSPDKKSETPSTWKYPRLDDEGMLVNL